MSTGCFQKSKARRCAEALVKRYHIDTKFLLSSMAKSGKLSDVFKDIEKFNDDTIEIIISKTAQF
jgi:hypothetical protein